ncbi:MAG: hypothetical protein Q4Q58_01300 [Thermoplasmata archaeon]|nr:hypothetical protein [Thermoplasmata archaeon]
MYLSVVQVADGEGQLENVNEIANTIRGDKDSIDAVMVIDEKGSPESIPGIHTLIREIRPPHMSVILVTSGMNPTSLDDLVGAGYVDRVAFRLEKRPCKEQLRSMDLARANRVDFVTAVVMDPTVVTQEDVLAIAEVTEGHDEFILLQPMAPHACYRKKDLNALSKSLKGKARNVRVLNDVRRPSDRGRRRG